MSTSTTSPTTATISRITIVQHPSGNADRPRAGDDNTTRRAGRGCRQEWLPGATGTRPASQEGEDSAGPVLQPTIRLTMGGGCGDEGRGRWGRCCQRERGRRRCAYPPSEVLWRSGLARLRHGGYAEGHKALLSVQSHRRGRRRSEHVRQECLASLAGVICRRPVLDDQAFATALPHPIAHGRQVTVGPEVDRIREDHRR